MSPLGRGLLLAFGLAALLWAAIGLALNSAAHLASRAAHSALSYAQHYQQTNNQ